jgi:hypothetical protein
MDRSSIISLPFPPLDKGGSTAKGGHPSPRHAAGSSCSLSESGCHQTVLERFTISADAFPCLTRCKFSRFSMVPSMFPPGAMSRLQHFKFDIRPEDCSSPEFIVNDLALRAWSIIEPSAWL